MPKDCSLEEQNKALRMSMRTLMENLTVEGEFKLQLQLGEKDLPSLVKQLMAENEEQGRDMNRLERRISLQSWMLVRKGSRRRKMIV